MNKLIKISFVFCILNINYVYPIKDTLRYIYFDYNILQRLVDEHTLSIEYKPFQYHSFVFSIGKIFSNGYFDEFKGLSPCQDKWPFFAYNGIDYKLGYRFNYRVLNSIDLYISSQFVLKNSLDLYIGPQIVLKNLYYQNKYFINDHGPEDGSDNFVRSENAIVKGINIAIGFRINAELLYGIIINCNCYAGLEYRNRQRNYTTYKSYNSMVPSDIEYHPVPLGSFTLNQRYAVPIIGFKLGLGIKY